MNKKIVIISAVWCPSCLILKKHLKKLKNEYPNIEMDILDYDLNEEEVNTYKVEDKLPVIISLIDDKENNRLIGDKNYEEILEFLKESEII